MTDTDNQLSTCCQAFLMVAGQGTTHWFACSRCGRPNNTFTPNECEESVIYKIRQRRDKGREKYGKTMERTDLSRKQWLQHAQEEAMDLAIYLERIMRDEN